MSTQFSRMQLFKQPLLVFSKSRMVCWPILEGVSGRSHLWPDNLALEGVPCCKTERPTFLDLSYCPIFVEQAKILGPHQYGRCPAHAELQNCKTLFGELKEFLDLSKKLIQSRYSR